MATTIGRVVRVSSALTLIDEDPLSAGALQLLGSNATHLARENGLRALGSHPGWEGKIYGPIAGAGFEWDNCYDDEAADGRVLWCPGPRLVRPYGEQAAFPKVCARWRWTTTDASPVHALLIVCPAWGLPRADTHPSATTSTAAVAYEDASLDVALALADVGPLAAVPEDWTVTPMPSPDESGEVLEIWPWLAFWSESNNGALPAHVRGVTMFLGEP